MSISNELLITNNIENDDQYSYGNVQENSHHHHLNNNNNDNIANTSFDKEYESQQHQINNNSISNNSIDELDKKKKRVTFPADIIKGYSDPPRRWKPGEHSTTDLLDSYCKSCEKQKCKPSAKLMQQLKALQDLDGINGEKVNVLNLKNERLDIRQVEALEEVFKRLSFKTVDLEGAYFDGDDCSSTLFEILDYYDTCEKLILSNNRSINILGLQALSRLLRKSICVENVDLRGYTFPDYYQFSYFARGIRLSTCLKILHLESSNIQGKLLILLLNALKDNQYVKELYLNENKLQPNDGMYIGGFLKENKHLDVLDLRTNQLQDLGLSHICSGLSEQGDLNGLKQLVLINNNLTANGLSYLSKALIHNQSLNHLNISQNLITNDGTFALKEALIANKIIDTLIIQKAKLTDEGAIALAEYLAETQSLNRLDLRENDIRLGGIMALTSSLKLNRTLTRLDIDKDLKKDSHIKDYAEQAKRLFQEINDYCARNKSIKLEKESELKLNDVKLSVSEESTNKNDLETSNETVFIDKDDIEEEIEKELKTNDKVVFEVEEDEDEEENEILKTIYTKNKMTTNSMPLTVIDEQISENAEEDTQNFVDYFDEVNDYQVVEEKKDVNSPTKAELIHEEERNVEKEEEEKGNTMGSTQSFVKEEPVNSVDNIDGQVNVSNDNDDNNNNNVEVVEKNEEEETLKSDDMELSSLNSSPFSPNGDSDQINEEEKEDEKMDESNLSVEESANNNENNEIAKVINDKSISSSFKLYEETSVNEGDESFDIDSSNSLNTSFQTNANNHSKQQNIDIESIVNAQLTINLNNDTTKKSASTITSTPLNIMNNNLRKKKSKIKVSSSLDLCDVDGDDSDDENDDSDIEVLASSIDNSQSLNQSESKGKIIVTSSNNKGQTTDASSTPTSVAILSLYKTENENDQKQNNDVLLNSICEADAMFNTNLNTTTTTNNNNNLNEVTTTLERSLSLNDEDLNTQPLKPFFTSKLTNSQLSELSEEILNEIGLK